MKTNYALWKEYLDSWPDGQWYDDCDEIIGGVPAKEIANPDDIDPAEVVEFTCGIVFANEKDRDGNDLAHHFRRWLKARSVDTVVCEFPKDKRADVEAFMKAVGGKVRAA